MDIFDGKRLIIDDELLELGNDQSIDLDKEEEELRGKWVPANGFLGNAWVWVSEEDDESNY